MKNLIWNSIVVIGSVLVTSGVIMALQMGVYYFFPLPAGTDITQIKDLETFTKVIPLAMMLAIEGTYIIGTLVGGYAVGTFARSDYFALAGILGAIMTTGNVLNIMAIPHPIWMVVLTMITFITCAQAGCYLARKI